MQRFVTWKAAGIAAVAVLLVGGGAAAALAVGAGGSGSAPATTAMSGSPDFDSAFASHGADPAPSSQPATGMAANGRLNTGVIFEAVARTLKMSPRDVKSQAQQGKSLSQMAVEHGSSRDALKGEILAGEKAYLDKNVASGAVTQQYADQTLQAFATRLDTLMDQSLNARRQQQ